MFILCFYFTFFNFLCNKKHQNNILKIWLKIQKLFTKTKNQLRVTFCLKKDAYLEIISNKNQSAYLYNKNQINCTF